METHALAAAAAANFAGKKITLMGLGLLGRGVGDAKFLARAGAELIVTDLKTETELAPSLAQLIDFPDIIYHLGGHRLEDFESRDLIIRAPNAPLDSPYLAHARSRGIPVEMDSALFVKLAMQPALAPGDPASGATTPIIVGVTGTRGKSTVTHIIYECARAAGWNARLGGNIKDTATLPLIEEISGNGSDGGNARGGKNGGDKKNLVILELDSWQLQGFEEDSISPHIAVWTNFMPDHMNYYHGDMDRYFRDKAAIARFQKPGDFFIAPREIREMIEARFGKLQAACITGTALPADWEIALPGEHNRANAGFALAAARCLGIPDEIVKEVLINFSSLPNRLELLGKKSFGEGTDEKRDIEFYNDSNATTPEATIAALRALKPRPIILIAGGSDKELDFAELAREIAGARNGAAPGVKKLILFEGKASEKLKALLPKTFPVTMAPDMAEAVAAAAAAAQSGDAILLSPAATSFGIFQNEYDRGEQFKRLLLK